MMGSTRKPSAGPRGGTDPDLAGRKAADTLPAPPPTRAARKKSSGAFEVDATRKQRPDPRREEE